MTDKRILIVGGGTFGLSTAYHLVKGGYKNVTVLEKSAYMPPEDSAGNDLNKIIRAEYEDPWYAELALEAMKEWRENPLFAPYYHQVGYLLANSPSAPEKARKTLAKSLSSISQHPAFAGQITPLESRQDIRSVAPVFTGPMDWRGYFNRLAGYAHSADALKATYAACCDRGVVFELGDAAASLAYEGSHCRGVTTASGKRFDADIVILTLGASVASLLPSIAPQITAKAWSVAHVQLTPMEAAQLKGIPVTYARDLGFFFEPDPKTHLLKLCPSGGGITNFGEGSISLPPADSSYIPRRDEDAVRRLLRETLPELAQRPLVHEKMCWVADTSDSDYVIDYVPGKKGLMVVTGDSGHAFKMLPVVGLWVKKVVEENWQSHQRWRWKNKEDGDKDVSWRVGNVSDLKDIEELSAKL